MPQDWLHFASRVLSALVLIFSSLILVSPEGLCRAQTSSKTSAGSSSTPSVKRGIDLASTGHCVEALAILKKAAPEIADKKLRYKAAMASAQCGMSVDQEDTVVKSLLLLNHEFPNDSRVLYITTRYYSELANRAALRLMDTNPNSAEAQQIVAEAYQAKGEYENATAKYRKILEQYPNQPGVHYQLALIILAKPPGSASTEEARKELEEELRINPSSPAAEFLLGDLAWKGQKSEEAIRHFSRATELDVTLAQPYLGLGIAFNGTGRFAEAIASLKRYVQLEPQDPAGYYQLAIAYARTGNRQEAERQRGLQLEAEKKWNVGRTTRQDRLQPN